jgi:hypothetical protein
MIPPGTPEALWGSDFPGGAPLNLYTVPSGSTFYLSDVFLAPGGNGVFELRESGAVRQTYVLSAVIGAAQLVSMNYTTPVVFAENTTVQFENVLIGVTSQYTVSISGFLVSSTPAPESLSDAPGMTQSTLLQNFPNPFSPATVVRYSVPTDGPVSVVIYDVQGRRVRTLADGFKSAGSYEDEWDGRDDSGQQVTSGVYFYQLNVGGTTQAKKMIRLR